VLKKGKESGKRSNSEAGNLTVLTPNRVFQHPAKGGPGAGIPPFSASARPTVPGEVHNLGLIMFAEDWRTYAPQWHHLRLRGAVAFTRPW